MHKYMEGIWPNEKNVLTNLDKNLSRSEVQEKTGHVVSS